MEMELSPGASERQGLRIEPTMTIEGYETCTPSVSRDRTRAGGIIAKPVRITKLAAPKEKRRMTKQHLIDVELVILA